MTLHGSSPQGGSILLLFLRGWSPGLAGIDDMEIPIRAGIDRHFLRGGDDQHARACELLDPFTKAARKNDVCLEQGRELRGVALTCGTERCPVGARDCRGCCFSGWSLGFAARLGGAFHLVLKKQHHGGR